MTRKTTGKGPSSGPVPGKNPPQRPRKASESSKRWIRRHIEDPFVHQAQQKGYRARSAFKLLEINKKTSLFPPRTRVLDLGCAPGGWCQVVRDIMKSHSVPLVEHQIVGVDCSSMEVLEGVTFLQGDITHKELWARMPSCVLSPLFQVVLSDIAPPSTGHAVADQGKMACLWETVLDLCHHMLAPQGTLVIKLFQGHEMLPFVESVKKSFQRVQYVKPAASRKESSEVYVVARQFHQATPQEM